MKEFSLPLMSEYARPVIKLYGMPSLIDTGAVVPVFSVYPYFLEKTFAAKMILPRGNISGFGGKEYGSVYSLKNFKVGELIFETLEVFVPDEPDIKFRFLLSATLFHGMDYEIDTINQKFTVRMNDEQNFNREFKIKDLEGKLFPQIDGVLFEDVDIELQDYQIFF
ncbi:MAG: hypothetical protein IJT73_09945 [Selenomonadaceae bacterium]|nr:hypothetical protein [Selenomonadaceae bacterium]